MACEWQNPWANFGKHPRESLANWCVLGSLPVLLRIDGLIFFVNLHTRETDRERDINIYIYNIKR